MKTPEAGVYSITCSANNKRHVGSSVNIVNRWKLHIKQLRRGNHHSILLQRAWDKYGESSFKFETLELVEDKTQLIIIEQKWLDFYNASDPSVGFNICPNAGNNLGTTWIPSKETRRRMSEARKGKSLSKETRCRISEALKGKFLSEEHRAQISKGLKGRKHSEETRRKISESGKGKHSKRGGSQ